MPCRMCRRQTTAQECGLHCSEKVSVICIAEKGKLSLELKQQSPAENTMWTRIRKSHGHGRASEGGSKRVAVAWTFWPARRSQLSVYTLHLSC